ncbi:Acyl-CoA synthetase (AMP-forming)/AMP-acid ligase II [Palleronia marisminoris]|uniref:Long-chain-fatty-acid--CoA ligase n=1 Tax=Palleronia marisminoris TaxID=315423 RepID=A0A1Y5S474_9RHOB|nr:acyl-CoA synthetase [Palleronia marisminoris]SFG62613.1 Acyl-CoA synthetase (AMP-forming)/AMP-acid ligase II [Palleronia marisminoris]SLN31817.1 Long-chain-fatty-acid--CoA ligase [Palleronia marisminoris]
MQPVSTRVMNLSHFLTETARRHPDEIGLVWGASRWSWAEIEARATAFAAALRDRYGMRKGDRILVQSANCNQMFEAAFACWKLGVVWVPANFRQTPEDVAWLAASSGAKGLLVGAEFPDHVAACAETITFRVAIGGIGVDDYEALLAAHANADVPAVAVDRDDPAWFFFTSGTTGKPKAAVLTHGQMAFVVTNHLCDLMPGTGPEDASLVVAPLSHGAGVHQLAQVAHGVKTILPAAPRFDPAEIWALVEEWRVTNMFTVPTIVKMLVEHEAVHAHDHCSLRYVIYAGAPMYRADQRRALEVLGPVLVQYFGLGEVTGNITVLPPAHHSADDAAMRIGTCGFARTGMQVAVQDAQGRECAPGQTGEVAVIGPAVFAGYHDNPEANAKSFRDGWFLTGDLGHMDAEGFLYLTGRASDMYISGGSNIYPREIEEKILLHPDISETAVLGVPDPQWGEVGIAVCVARGTAPDATALLEWLGERLARYKIPKKVVFWDEMPKSAYGKITKKMIRAELLARGEIGDG